ncbi:hypothetical protein B0H17DRAFT_1195250 [Mycena rosella]|uniref:Uncharacterized protein n=1 Tax=Mycena rosella TaxID=1033263 RepID=A0AAD7DWI0_MYCRO|nr:hypothetical protein B0H17DRAFT_1195250 [Mycena rosella]
MLEEQAEEDPRVLPDRIVRWGPLLLPPKPYKPHGAPDEFPSLYSAAHPLRRDKWLRETDAFFTFQSAFFLAHNADVPAERTRPNTILWLTRRAQIHALLADMKDHLAVLEREVQKSDVLRDMSHQDRAVAWLLEWEALDTGMEALDAICWGFPWVKPVHGEYKNYGEIRALAHEKYAFDRRLRKRGSRAWEYVSFAPLHITNAYRILFVERDRLHIPVKFFLALAKKLGISTELQLEMATVEKPTGGSFFVW